MKVLIICLTYSQGFSYMENQLAKAFLNLGCDITLVASTDSYVKEEISHFPPGVYFDSDGFSVTRLPFSWGGGILSHKLWKVKGLLRTLNKYHPDIIYHMGICGFETKTTTSYVKQHPEVSLFFDNHAAFYNSGKNWISKNIRYKLLLGKTLREASNVAAKIFYIGEGEKQFIKELFKIPDEKLEHFPLGDFFLDEKEYQASREKIRKSLHYNQDDVVVFHTGKLGLEKKTYDIVQAVLAEKNDSLKLCIVGGMVAEVEKKVLPLIEAHPTRITYLGWKDSIELSQLLCAGDVYVQFSVSSTFLTAMCRKCIGISVNPKNTYQFIPKDVYIEINDKQDLEEIFHKIIRKDYDLLEIKEKSYSFSQKNLNYENLVKSKILKRKESSFLD